MLAHASRCTTAHPHARIAACPGRPGQPKNLPQEPLMDIEQVNAIGSLLADLSARTEQLRGYL